MNTNLRIETEIEFQKNFLKEMYNANFWKNYRKCKKAQR